MKLRKSICILLVLCLLLLPGTCFAADYSVQEQELTRLEQIFDKLQTNSELQEQEFQKQKIQLQNLKSQLIQAENSIQATQNSLARANESLQQSAREVKKIKAQRTAAVVVAVAGLLYAVFKK